MEELKLILVRIKNGERSFRPQRNDSESLDEFQQVAMRIIHADKKGYIQEMKFLKDYTTTGGKIKNIVISGGLTFEGEQFLTMPVKMDCDASPKEDIIEIKPNIAGVGLNVNALCRYLRKIKNKDK